MAARRRDYGEVDGSGAGRPGATLILRVDPARALDIQYKTAQMIERINVYFGYRAVTDLRILQTPIDAPAASAKPVQPPRPAHPKPQALASVPALDAVTDDALRAALQKLQAGIASAIAPPETPARAFEAMPPPDVLPHSPCEAR